MILFLLSIVILHNMTMYFAMPSISPDDDHFVKRFDIAPWVIKRNPTLCDYRFQLRPLPLNSALCNYGKIQLNRSLRLFISLFQVMLEPMTVNN